MSYTSEHTRIASEVQELMNKMLVGKTITKVLVSPFHSNPKTPMIILSMSDGATLFLASGPIEIDEQGKQIPRTPGALEKM